MNMAGFLAVGVGAALGAWLRWGLNVAMYSAFPALPMGTLIANLVGGFLIGVSVEVFLLHADVDPVWRLFIITGFLGGLTTFSTFSAESVALLSTARYGLATAHIALHLAGSILMTIAGMRLTGMLLRQAS